MRQKRLDEANGDTLWWDAICKEMKNVRIAFEEFEGDVSAITPGYQEIRCHMIFDIKMGETSEGRLERLQMGIGLRLRLL